MFITYVEVLFNSSVNADDVCLKGYDEVQPGLVDEPCRGFERLYFSLDILKKEQPSRLCHGCLKKFMS